MGRSTSLIVRSLVVLAVGVGLLLTVDRTPESATASAPPPAMGTPFTVDGYTITLRSLRPVAEVDPSIEPLRGSELWVLQVDVVNDTGHEVDVGTGFRIQSDQGVIHSANPLNVVGNTLRGTLAPGGRTSGTLSFSVPLSEQPVAVLVKPAGTEVSVPVT